MVYKTNRNITMIEDLPDLDQLDGHHQTGSMTMQMIPEEKMKQVQRVIRQNDYNPPSESGMTVYRPEMEYNEPTIINNYDIDVIPSSQQSPYMMQQQAPAPSSYIHNLSCVDVAEHTISCVVCSRLYQNNANGYIVVIILLSIICILLLKRVLNV